MSRNAVAEVVNQLQGWITKQRERHVPSLGLDQLAVSESEARAAARELISALADEEAPRIGVSYERIRIGAQRSLWGSCSPSGSLCFNWPLPGFWRLVGRHCPGWREQRGWLRRHGAELLAFRPQP